MLAHAVMPASRDQGSASLNDRCRRCAILATPTTLMSVVLTSVTSTAPLMPKVERHQPMSAATIASRIRFITSRNRVCANTLSTALTAKIDGRIVSDQTMTMGTLAAYVVV